MNAAFAHRREATGTRRNRSSRRDANGRRAPAEVGRAAKGRHPQQSENAQRRRAAFTLLEMLAASALAAILMLVLFQVIGSLGRTRAALSQNADDERPAAHTPWKSDLLDTLLRDLTNASAVEVAPNRLSFTSHGSLDSRTLAAGHEPVTVVYELISDGAANTANVAGRSHLVRRQSRRGGLTVDRGWSELLCANVTGFRLAPIRGGRATFIRPDVLASPLRIRIDGPDGPVLDELIVTR